MNLKNVIKNYLPSDTESHPGDLSLVNANVRTRHLTLFHIPHTPYSPLFSPLNVPDMCGVGKVHPRTDCEGMGVGSGGLALLFL
jgi:hypothetical protein